MHAGPPLPRLRPPGMPGPAPPRNARRLCGSRPAARTSGLISQSSQTARSYPPAAELARWEAAEVVLRLHHPA